ncbi:helix-turn-helix domain-containing protein [Roseococcus sp. SDR]|uniref:IclR family transcriptional regulator n=1 Tax=Roseococcus sp. SDR TaxID=2835532 RepID=UPI001BCEFF22|nr:helix-turn-helix domain-containing protein [Roseococcus sp. SDR]MBS7789142.1 helix-turn-helix domain-containing protein [Roseococcus sp. SDR]MBV1844456.1 helix-turn-helix domain-containing protein [Roseococcus sp. SDR]
MKPRNESSGRPEPRSGGIVAVERSLSILDAFLGATTTRGLSELARATGLAKPTVLRNLVSLERRGYIVRLADGRYQLGARLLQLGEAYRAQFRLEDHVMPVLRDLAALTGETVTFQVREGENRLTLFRVESPQIVRIAHVMPNLKPLDRTSISHTLLHGDAAADAARRRQTVFFSAGLADPQTASLSTAIWGPPAQLCGAMNISGPIMRLSTANLDALSAQLAAAARGLCATLGAPFPDGMQPPELIRISPPEAPPPPAP